MQPTLLSDAMKKAGVNPAEIRLQIALMKWIDAGGDFEGLKRAWDAVCSKLPGADHVTVAPKDSGRCRYVGPGQPNASGGGRCKPVQQDHGVRAVPACNLTEESDRRLGIQQDRDVCSISPPPFAGGAANHLVPALAKASLPPAGDPESLRRPFAPSPGRIEAKRALSRKFFTLKTVDGVPWADVHAHELAQRDRDGALARIIKDRLGPLNGKQRFAPLKEIMTADQFDDALVLARAAEEFDVAPAAD